MKRNGLKRSETNRGDETGNRGREERSKSGLEKEINVVRPGTREALREAS